LAELYWVEPSEEGKGGGALKACVGFQARLKPCGRLLSYGQTYMRRKKVPEVRGLILRVELTAYGQSASQNERVVCKASFQHSE